MARLEVGVLLATLLTYEVYLVVCHKAIYSSRDSNLKGKKDPVSLVCYFGLTQDWPDNGTLHPALNSTLCSHILFICNSNVDCQMGYDEAKDARYFNKIPLLRKLNPKLKILITNCGEFNHVLRSQTNRTKFVQSIIPYLKRFDFDGIDLDWEYPRPVGQRINFTLILKEIRQAFDQEVTTGGKRYIFSAAVSGGPAVMAIYNVSEMAKSVDFINMMGYDLHSYSRATPYTGHNSPLYPTDWPKNRRNVAWAAYEYHNRGMPMSKIMVGVPTYTHTWTLKDPAKHGLGAFAVGPGRTCNECTYPWVCGFLQTNGSQYVWDGDAAVPYTYNGDQWVSFDDVRSLASKARWIVDNGFAGVMIYSINSEDFYGEACKQGKFPLLTAVRKEIDNSTYLRY